MTNPMTTLGDVIIGGASGVPGRLGIGSTGNVLTVASGSPAWVAPTGGGDTTATYITQTADGALSNSQHLSALATGLVKVTTATGVLSTAVAADVPNLAASQITSGQLVVAQGGTGLGTLTAHAVMLGEGTSTPGFAAIGTAGRVLLDQGAAADPAWQVMSGDIAISATGVTTIQAGSVALGDHVNLVASSIMANPTGSAAAPSAVTLAGGLAFSGTTLTAAALAPLASPTFTGTVTLPVGLTGLAKLASGVVSAAAAGADYLAPSGSGAALTGITESQVTNLVTDLAAKAPLASPTFTGSVILPAGTVTLAEHANLASVSLMANPTGSAAAPSAVTLAGGLSFTGTTLTAAALAPLASPTFTGVPAAPTATSGTNTTQVATTAFVTTAVSGAALPTGAQNLVVATPTGSTGVSSLRSLVAGDLPTTGLTQTQWVNPVTTVTGSNTLNFATTNNFLVNLTASALTTLTLSGMVTGQRTKVATVQPSTIGTLQFAGQTVTWIGGVAGVATASPNFIDEFVFDCPVTGTILGYGLTSASGITSVGMTVPSWLSVAVRRLLPRER